MNPPASSPVAASEPTGRCCYGGIKTKRDCASCAAWSPLPRVGMTDRELLEAAAKAAGIDASWDDETECLRISVPFRGCSTMINYEEWNPLTDDGDALRLAVKLGFEVSCDGHDMVAVGWPDSNHPDSAGGCTFYSHIFKPKGSNPYAATRRAVVRAAAAIASKAARESGNE